MNLVLLDYLHSNVVFRVMVLFILGAIIGSFLNVVIHRLPIILMRKWRRESAETLEIEYIKIDDYPERCNLLLPASQCINCKCNIPFWANIPLLGFFIVKGKCANCHIKISPTYFWVELLCSILFAYVGYTTPDLWLLVLKLVFISFVFCSIMIDWHTFLLPDELTLLLLWLGLLVNWHGLIAGSLASSVVGGALGYMSLWLVYWLFKLLTKRDGLGYGDFKFLAAILAWVGVDGFIPVLLIAPILGIIYFLCAYLLGFTQLHKPIPFGPFLGIAAIIVLLCGRSFILQFPL